MSAERPLVPEGSVNHALVRRGPVPRRRFKVGEVALARAVFSIIPRRGRGGRRSGAWRTFVPAARVPLDATARRASRADGDLERIAGLRPPDMVHGVPSEPRYRPPETR